MKSRVLAMVAIATLGASMLPLLGGGSAEAHRIQTPNHCQTLHSGDLDLQAHQALIAHLPEHLATC